MEGQPLLTAAEMRWADRFTIEELGIPSLVLMEVAGRAVADAAERCLREVGGSRVLVVAGTGNNGADGVVAARHLRERGVEVDVLGVGSETKSTTDGRTQAKLFRRLGGRLEFLEGGAAVSEAASRVAGADLVIDGLFGIGLDRPVVGYRAQVLQALQGAPSVAVDVPSGLHADTGAVLGQALPAIRTVTFQFTKLGLAQEPGRSMAGPVEVVDIGIPRRVLKRLRPAARVSGPPALPVRPRIGHKGTFGHLLVVAGDADRPGSALLACRAALRAGAGLVTLGSTAPVIARLAPSLVEVMGLRVGEASIDRAAVERALAERSGMLVGPSLPGDGRTWGWLSAVLRSTSAPVVLDAGALRAVDRLESLQERPDGAVRILTPHPGEMAGLLGLDTGQVQADRVDAARTAASRSGAVVILKGASTVVAGPDGQVSVCLRGNPGLGTGGTGDVLGGIVAGSMVQGPEAFDAAEAAVWVHGAAGDRAAEARSERGLVASDLLDAVASVLSGLEKA